jgi:hypothetical protein
LADLQAFGLLRSERAVQCELEFGAPPAEPEPNVLYFYAMQQGTDGNMAPLDCSGSSSDGISVLNSERIFMRGAGGGAERTLEIIARG